MHPDNLTPRLLQFGGFLLPMSRRYFGRLGGKGEDCGATSLYAIFVSNLSRSYPDSEDISRNSEVVDAP